MTAQGEAITASLDDAAAKCFIENGFTYRTRRDPTDLTVLRDDFVANRVYDINAVDTRVIRLFALSLLWRSAVSRLPAFELVKARPSHIEDLRRRIVSGDPGPHDEFATYFGVFCGTDELAKIAPYGPRNHPFYRFFLDGVVCYVCPRRRLKTARDYGLLLVGSEPKRINLLCFSSLDSNHARYCEKAANELYGQHGNVFAGFEKPRQRET